MPRRRYTHQDRANAVVQAEVNGAERAAEDTGIPRTTILYWLDQPGFVELRQKTREEKRDGYRVLIAKAQQRLAELVPSMEPKDLINLMGVSQDKDLLLSGDATSRSETRDTTHDIDPDTRKRITDWLDRRLEPDARATDGVPEDASSAVR